MPRHKLTPEDRIKGGQNSKRGKSPATLLNKYDQTKIDGEDLTYEEKIALKLLKKAADDDEHLGWIKEYYDRKYGKAVQQVEADINTTQVIHVPDDMEGV